MKKQIFTLSLLFSAFIFGQEMEPRITGPGVQDIDENEFSGAVGVYIRSEDGYANICTGTVIHKRVVLTAAHCIYSTSHGIDHRNAPERIRIVTGETIIPRTNQKRLSETESVSVHPQWSGANATTNDRPDPDNADIALIKMQKSVDTEVYELIDSDPQIDESGVIIGYGLISDADQNSYGTRRKGSSSIKHIESGLIEIGIPNGTCTGDSGGPLFLQRDGKYVVAGVTSFGYTPPNNLCEPDWGNYDSNVAFYRSWIISEVERLTANDTEVPDEGNTQPDEGNTQPDEGNSQPDEGNTQPDEGGNTRPDEDNTGYNQPDENTGTGNNSDNSDVTDEENTDPVIGTASAKSSESSSGGGGCSLLTL